MKHYSSGEQNSQEKWIVINLKKIMHIILDICMVKRVNETIIKPGAAQKYCSCPSLDKENIMDALLKILGKTKLNNY